MPAFGGGGGFTRAWIAHFQAALEHRIRTHGLKAFHKNTLELKSEIKQNPTHYKHLKILSSQLLYKKGIIQVQPTSRFPTRPLPRTPCLGLKSLQED